MQAQVQEAHSTLLAKEYNKAFALYSTLAERKEPTSFYYLRALYDMGLGCEEDKEKAIKWCRKAAYQGHEKAKGIIRRLHQDGQIAF